MKLQVRHELDVEPPLRLLANEKAESGNVLLRRRGAGFSARFLDKERVRVRTT